MTQFLLRLRYTVHFLSMLARIDRMLTWWSAPVLALLTLRAIIKKTLNLPHLPWTSGDGPSYLTFSEIRPHGYPIFLHVYSLIFPDLKFLPSTQATMYYISVAFAAFAISHKERSFICGIITFLLATINPFVNLAVGGVMSDTLYTACLMIGLSFYLLFLSGNRLLFLLCASLFVGIAAVTRTIGYVPMVMLLISAGFHSWSKHWARLIPEVSATIIPLAACLLIAATSNYVKNGDFRIGTWGGVSLLGKGLMVAEPVPLGDPLHKFNWIPEKTQAAKVSLDNIDNYMLKMLVQRLDYEYLRWFFLWDELDRHGQPFLTERAKTQHEIASKLALAYVSHSPWAYASLMWYDYLSLWVVPRILTSSESRALQLKFDGSRVAYLPELWRANGAKFGEYFAVVPTPSPYSLVLMVRLMSASFGILSLLLLVGIVMRRSYTHRAEVSDLVFLFGTVHVSYALTALVEAGLDRYVGGTWPMLLAAVALVSIRTVRLSSRAMKRVLLGLAPASVA